MDVLNKYSHVKLIIINHLLESSQSTCEDITDCFNCSMSTNNCEWNKKQCSQLSGKKVYSNWWDAFDNCGDVASVAIMNQYCGEFEKNKDNNYKITLTENQGQYGSTNLFCSYLYRTSKHNPRLKMEITNHLMTDNTKLELIIFYIDTNLVDKIIIDNHKELEYDNVALVELFFYIKHPMSINPFEIVFKETEKGALQIWIYVVVVIVSILFPFTVIFLCFYIHYLFKKSGRRHNPDRDNLSSQESNRGLSGHTTGRPKVVIDNLFTTTLKPINYDKDIHLKYGSKCTICLEDLKTNELISITLCQHVFHYKCLSNWLYKTGAGLRCPNCNQDLENKAKIEVNHFDEVTVINVRTSEAALNTRNIQMVTTTNE